MKLNLNSVFTIAILVLVVSCNSKHKELKFSDFKISNIKYPIEGDSTRSFTYEASIPVFEDGSQQLIDSINIFISQKFFEHENNITDLKQLVKAESDSFYQDYLRDFSDFNEADFPLTYNYNVEFAVAFHNNKYLTLINENYEYTGGAHGNYATLYYVFDVTNGKRLFINELVADTSKLKQFAFKEFCKIRNIDASKPINDQGYWFEKNEFSLNSNFGLISDTLIFTYNPYEITNYAEGLTELKIPMSLFK
jgi:hypothetical protein